MANQDEVKKWFATCFHCSISNKYNVFTKGYGHKHYRGWHGKNLAENIIPIDGVNAYCPDIILEDRQSEKIKYIVEIETGSKGKDTSCSSMKVYPGAIVLADYCVGKLLCPGTKFRILFIICYKEENKGENGEREYTKHARIRAKIAESYGKNIEKIRVYEYEKLRQSLDQSPDPESKLDELFTD